MTKTSTLIVTFQQPTGAAEPSADCVGVSLSSADHPTEAGKVVVTAYLGIGAPANPTLRIGGRDQGSGRDRGLGEIDRSTTAQIVLSGSNSGCLSVPLTSIDAVRASSDLVTVSDGSIVTLASAGGPVTGWKRSGSGVYFSDHDQIWGSLSVSGGAPNVRQWVWTPPDQTATWPVFLMDGTTVLASSTISVTASSGSGGGGDDPTPATKKDVIIQVVEYSQETSVAGASIWVDGSMRGVTNAEGLLTVNRLALGDHTLKITATGYLASDQDTLANEGFTVT